VARYDYPLIVIGAGAGGLVVAVGAAKIGKKVLLIEKGNWGGDCTFFGCIPSKAIIASAKQAQAIDNANAFGIRISQPSFDGVEALDRAQEIITRIAATETPEALNEKGIDTLTGIASFIDPHTIIVPTKDGTTREITGDQIVIATGSHPRIPRITGIKDVAYYTNETLFSLKTIPQSLGIIGGGPISCEIAQAFRSLGSQVIIIQENEALIPKEDPEAQRVLQQIFAKSGITVHLHHEPTEVKKDGDWIRMNVVDLKSGRDREIRVSHLFVAAGRLPTLSKLNLPAAGVESGEDGIVVNRYGQTTQKNIWAVGDVTGEALYTHVAEAQGRAILQNILLPRLFWKQLPRPSLVPRVLFTDPEIAAIGLSEAQATLKYGNSIQIYTVPFESVDRAITDGRTEGFVKIITKKWSGKIIGATIVAPRAGEMLMEISLAMNEGISLRKLATLVHPYPTYNQAIRMAADQWFVRTIMPLLRRWLGFRFK